LLAGAPPARPASIGRSAELDAFLSGVAAETVASFSKAGLTAEGLSIALVDLSPREALASGAFRGDASYYPASVVKLFFLAYYEAEKEASHLKDSPELVRAVKDMITVSSNDATGFVVDSVTSTTSGPEIADAKEWEAWKTRRNVVNRFLEARGYRDVNANQKTFCEDAYGREQAFRDGGRNRNRATAEAVARLFTEISRGEMVGQAGTEEMLKLLSRDVAAEKPFEDMELEDARLAGKKLPAGTKVWAKSGDAYDVHHLVARVQLSNGGEFVLAVFTKGVKAVPGVIPSVFEKVAARFAAAKP
jgi:hypothetical protein